MKLHKLSIKLQEFHVYFLPETKEMLTLLYRGSDNLFFILQKHRRFRMKKIITSFFMSSLSPLSLHHKMCTTKKKGYAYTIASTIYTTNTNKHLMLTIFPFPLWMVLVVVVVAMVWCSILIISTIVTFRSVHRSVCLTQVYIELNMQCIFCFNFLRASKSC